MRAVMVDVPEAMLAERRRVGADRWDEMWEGVLHLVPPASGKHQRLSGDLFVVLVPLARAKGLVPHMETGLFRSPDDHRVPDQVYALPEQVSDRGVEGGVPLVVEILSPGDETYAKLDWYAALAVEAVLVLEPDTHHPELFVNRGERMVLLEATPLPVAALGVELIVMDGPRLRLAWPGGGTAEV